MKAETTTVSNSSHDHHAYSCKRCRRLKKKCTRTIPICQNCSKAGEFCEYVPRAPRRKKIEILKLRNQANSSTENLPMAPNFSASQMKQHTRMEYDGSMNHVSHTGHTSTSFGTSGNISLTPILSPSHQFPLAPRTRSVSDVSNSSLKQFAYGTTEQIPYNNIENFSFSTLPPITSITNTVPLNTSPNAFPNPNPNSNLHPHPNSNPTTNLNPSPSPSPNPVGFPSNIPSNNGSSDFNALAQSFNFNGNQLSQQFGPFPNNQFSFAKLPSSVPSPKSTISSVDSSLIRKIVPNNPASIQNKLFNSMMGIRTNEINPILRPEFPRSLVIQCADSFFLEFSRPYPFLNRIECIENIQAIDLERLETMEPKKVFEIYMILLIGYSALERRGKIPTDQGLKAYLTHKTIDQIPNVVNYQSVSSIRQLLLLGIYLFFDDNGATCWYLAGLITRLALSLGLNRQPSKHGNTENSSEEELEYRKRLLWSVYSYDRQVASCLNRPFGLNDEDIDLLPLNSLPHEDPTEIQQLNTMIDYKRLEGKIMKVVHSVNAASRFKTEETKSDVLDGLRTEIENWYTRANDILVSNRRSASIMNYSVSWYGACYYEMILLLYRPSFLVPNPSQDTMEVVGKATLQSFSYLYNLLQVHQVPLFWTHLYKLISIFSAFIHCLITNSIDLTQLKTELALAIELSEFYSTKWSVATDIGNSLKQVNITVLNAKLGYNFTADDREESNRKLIACGQHYFNVLSDHKVDIWFDDPLIANVFAMSGT